MPAPAGRIGARVKRGDDPRLLTGRGRYLDDLTLPRMVHVAFVRSAHAHARLARVGLDAARGAPGVAGVLGGEAAARLCKPYRGILLHYRGMKTGAHHLETPAPGIAGGFKGAGEAGATGAPAAILNAVNDALAPLGVMLTDQPITPERVVRALLRKAWRAACQLGYAGLR